MTRYFKVPNMTDRSPGNEGNDLGRPGIVTGNQSYTPDRNGVIAVDDPEDQTSFARHQGWIEIVGSNELPPAPPPTHDIFVTDTAGASSAGEAA